MIGKKMKLKQMNDSQMLKFKKILKEVDVGGLLNEQGNIDLKKVQYIATGTWKLSQGDAQDNLVHSIIEMLEETEIALHWHMSNLSKGIYIGLIYGFLTSDEENK